LLALRTYTLSDQQAFGLEWDHIMRFVTRKEIEYLGSVDGHVTESAELIDEMCQRLDALRRYDQNFSDSDWHPHALARDWHPDFR
jgi:hypothetical protein